MRIAVLWQSMSGYFSASLRALADVPGVELCLAFRSAQPQAPFDQANFDWINPQYSWDQKPSVTRLDGLLADFDPDAVLVSSWHIGGYRAALRHLRRQATRVLCMDKQWLARLASRQDIRPFFDVACVLGDRPLAFGNRLGFRESHVLRGLYFADTELFRLQADDPHSPDFAFLFVGRLIELKKRARGTQAPNEHAVQHRPLISLPG